MVAGQVLVFAAILAVFPIFSNGDTCLRPSPVAETYTTQEAAMSTSTVFIVEFQVTCANDVKNINLYAEIDGRTVPATRSQNSNAYQVSWSDEHKKLPSGLYKVRFFDEDKFAVLRKAQRSGEDISQIEPLFVIDVNHKGAYTGPAVQTEFLATSVAALVWYLAYSAKNRLQS